MPTPSSVDSGYAELVMHLPKDWEVSTSALDSTKYAPFTPALGKYTAKWIWLRTVACISESIRGIFKTDVWSPIR